MLFTVRMLIFDDDWSLEDWVENTVTNGSIYKNFEDRMVMEVATLRMLMVKTWLDGELGGS